MPKSNTPINLSISDTSTTMSISNTPTTLPISNALSTIPISNTQTSLPISNVSTNMPISDTTTTLPISNTQTTILTSNTPITILKSNAPNTIPISNAPTTISKSNSPTTMPKSNTPTNISISDISTTMPISNTPTTILKSNATTTTPMYNASTTNSISTRITHIPETTQITEKIKAIATTLDELTYRFLLGFDGFLRTKTSVVFNTYFIKDDGFSEIMYLYLKILYLKFRKLNNKIEEKKVECHLCESPIYNQIKYNYSLNIQDQPIINIKVLDKFEFSDKAVNLSGISPMALKYKYNLQNANPDYFSKRLYLLQDSVTEHNRIYFNISGNMDDQNFNYNNLTLQFNLKSEDTEETKNATCTIIQTNETKYTLKCIPPPGRTKGNIDLPFSDLGDSNLVVLFKNESNLIDVGDKKKVRLTAIIIVYCLLVLIIALAILGVWKMQKNKKNKKNEDYSDSQQLIILHKN